MPSPNPSLYHINPASPPQQSIYNSPAPYQQHPSTYAPAYNVPVAGYAPAGSVPVYNANANSAFGMNVGYSPSPQPYAVSPQVSPQVVYAQSPQGFSPQGMPFEF